MANPIGIYIHIPFCKSKCDYCDFYSLAGQEEQMDRYQRALLTHLRQFAPQLKKRVADTIYFGGGTPSYYGERRLREILSLLQRLCTVRRQAEITVECNPDSVDWRSMARLRRAGVNRISLGAQSADEQQLRCIHRIHSPRQVVQAVTDIRKAKIENLSLDLILGLPGQTMASWEDTLRKALSLNPDHISCYGLKVEENTPLALHVADGLVLPDDDAQADLYLRGVELLRQSGFRQYEISNFAKPGFEGRHNVNYWNCGDYLGLGPAAHSCMGGKRFYTPTGTAAFCEKPVEYVPDGACTAEDFVMLQLRLVSGLSLTRLEQEYGVVWSAQKRALAAKLCQNGLARMDGDVLSLTPRGMLVQNSILSELI